MIDGLHGGLQKFLALDGGKPAQKGREDKQGPILQTPQSHPRLPNELVAALCVVSVEVDCSSL